MSPQSAIANVFCPTWNMTKGSHLLSDVSMCLKSKKQEWGNGIIQPAMEEIQLWAAVEQAST